MLAGDEWHDEDLVFAQPNGRPIDKKADYKPGASCSSEAGVRHVRLHDGRHTAATLLLSEGVHPRVVMELLGHSQMRTTMDIYSHVMPALAREAADRMGAVLLARAARADRADAGDRGRTATNCNQSCNQTNRDDLAGGSSPLEMGGAEGTRTPDPHTASVVRYQLRHSPKSCLRHCTRPAREAKTVRATKIDKMGQTGVGSPRRRPANAGIPARSAILGARASVPPTIRSKEIQ